MNYKELIEIILAATMAIVPIGFLLHRTFSKKQSGDNFGIGVRSIQFISVGMLLPAVVLLSFEKLIDGCTVAALVGSLVGYLFSGIVSFDQKRTNNSN